MQIIEYEDKYLDDVKDLLVELEEYIVSIDKDNLDQVHPEYREKMAIIDLEEVKNNNGKCYIAVEDDKAIGLIMGCIFPYDEYDYLDYKCPKRGEITELIVSKNARSKGIGNMLMNKMEDYFKSDLNRSAFCRKWDINRVTFEGWLNTCKNEKNCVSLQHDIIMPHFNVSGRWASIAPVP